jgi:uncharacterized protein (TIGR02996 family)
VSCRPARGTRLWYARRLLDQILADPADDALRMVYADQLIARGDPRGEYIAVERSLAAAARGSEERAALSRRRAELRAAHAAEWWPELPEQRIGTRRGFVETVAVYVPELGRVGALAAREPIAALELLEHPSARVTDAPWHARIRRLVVQQRRERMASAHRLGAEGRAVLDALMAAALPREAAPWEGALEATVEELAIADPGIALLPFGDHLPRCRHLCLAGMGLADIQQDGQVHSPLRALETWQHIARLEVLDLSHCQIQGAAVAAVAALELPALRVLRLSGNPLGPAGAAAIAGRLRALPALERLELLDTGIGAMEAADLRAAGARAELLVDAVPPDRLALDAVGSELELARVNESEWAISLDGERKPIRLRRRDAQGMAIDTMVERTVLGRVVRALWTGAPRRIGPEGIAVPVGGPGHADAWFAIAPDHSEVRYEPWGPY